LKGEAGCLFLEIFTHRGKGTLLTNDYPNVIRRGQISDVMDIALLLKPYISSGAILSVSEDAIADEVEDYYVYTVNNSIVAISKLTDHGPAIELAKFCTLPRYQGKGRARELAEKMIETVKQANKEFIFALSIEPKMFEFFKSLGFEECTRECLPENWKKQYDMSRSSKAFKLIV
jgi:amino-acid N-acetyltransferase